MEKKIKKIRQGLQKSFYIQSETKGPSCGQPAQYGLYSIKFKLLSICDLDGAQIYMSGVGSVGWLGGGGGYTVIIM